MIVLGPNGIITSPFLDTIKKLSAYSALTIMPDTVYVFCLSLQAFAETDTIVIPILSETRTKQTEYPARVTAGGLSLKYHSASSHL